MPRQIVEYSLLISCPGDVVEEIKIINDVVNKFNSMYTDTLGLRVRVKHWSTDSYAESGAKPQQLLNKQFVYDCDAAIAVLWTRFGTPTDKYGSGTEEEIEYMLQMGKQVFMYFSDIPTSPSKQDGEQYNRIKRFKDRYKERGLYFEYSSLERFKDLFLAHLSQYFLTVDKVEEVAEKIEPKLRLKSIHNDRLDNKLVISKFETGAFAKTEQIKDEIRGLFERIETYRVVSKEISIEDKIGLSSMLQGKPVTISQNMKDIITKLSEIMNINISNSFFDLGDLRKSVVDLGSNLQGTPDEREKYNAIIELYDKIIFTIGWMPFEEKLERYMCVRLVVINEGTKFDEDIDVSVEFNKRDVILHNELPIPESDFLNTVKEDVVPKLFGISKTIMYQDYWSSIKESSTDKIVNATVYPFNSNMSEEEEYLNELDDEFAYEYYEREDKIVLNIHYDYLKHNSAVAFPTVIFVEQELNKIIYRIKSKNMVEEVQGELQI